MRAFLKKLLTNGNASPGAVPEAEPTPMQRWSPEQLAQTKAYLEARRPKDITTDDHYLIVDYLVQRYLPQDDVRTEAQWQEAKTKLRAKVDANIEKAKPRKPDEPGDWELRNAAEARRRELLSTSYFVSREEFDRLILGALARFPFGAGVKSLSADDAESLWQASATLPASALPADRYKVRDAKNGLVRYHPAMLETCTTLRRNYEVLRRAQTAGCIEVKAIVRQGCACYGAALDGKRVRVDAALAAFESDSTHAPLLPPPQADCCLREDPRLCDVTLLPVMPSGEGDDPEFGAWLEDLF
jgi:hypothetical protein